MNYALRDGLSFCSAESRTIILDLHSGRYVALADCNHDAFRRWVTEQDPSETDRHQLKKLAERGILAVVDNAAIPKPITTVLPIATHDRSATISPIETIRALIARLLWKRRLRRWTLQRIVARLKKNAIEVEQPRSEAALASILRAFEFTDLLVGSHDRCLERSLALVATCRNRGLQAEVVVGVQTDPFAAHCWVQRGATVLNERPDRVRMFMPILVA
ncbi:lasso peptide biosynthesis B2 protein [Sphingopyxis sp. DBS4]|uniref:lasso peptide biosynthesis B2 protein n=1 Tax=Sphingopyxis sp. DBS4 TaxID=2968500 RepID=UPI00214C854E|nr:lasso peptide biosynthesis B2 protein [Sphingopyxis sp. DBS4]